MVEDEIDDVEALLDFFLKLISLLIGELNMCEDCKTGVLGGVAWPVESTVPCELVKYVM